MKKRRSQLNLRGYQVFEAVARHLSVTAAAAELGITQSAASHQLRKLADMLGEELVERRGRAVGLTEAGRTLAASLGSAFDLIEQSASAVVGGSRTMLRLGVYSSFAMAVMIPMLPEFFEKHPGFDLRLVMLHDPHDISGRIADVFITSEPVGVGYWSRRLFPEKLVPVVLTEAQARLDAPVPLITADVEPGLAGRDWEAFTVLNELDIATLRQGPLLCCTHYVLALEMVRAGMGAALVPDFMARPLLQSGALHRLPGRALPTGLNYSLQIKYERRNEPDILRFIAWLRAALQKRPFDI
ncbi:LysR family transcriptional regulator [Shinella sumterensis]|uniref:LysR family transcriptional regulator n=1 Tax=Shinella sumterensis TaxID=1967501 RepID=UPI003F87AE29